MEIQTPFDALAETYEQQFVHLRIGQMQRQLVWNYLLPLVNKRPLRILELNCGTGEDAARLASMGHSVIATDASSKMIAQCTIKMGDRQENLQFVRSSFEEIKSNFTGHQFDLIFSNFAGINCIDKNEILQLQNDAWDLLSEDGHIFLVALSKACIWEFLFYTMQGNLSTATRRWKNPARFETESGAMDIFYYGPSVMKKLFHGFDLSKLAPVGFFVPPSYLENHIPSGAKWLNKLFDWDQSLQHWSILSNFADHYCMELKKRNRT